MIPGLKAPSNLKIDFAPSARQYEVWKNLQPECPLCGGNVTQVQNGVDRNGNPTYTSVCENCGNDNIPQIILGGGAAGGGKCLNINSLVCTPFGFRALKELKVGDIISNPMTGGQQRIIWIHPKGKFPFYRIHFVDGTSTECSEGHLWKCHKSSDKTKRRVFNPDYFALVGDDNIWTTKDMYEWYQRKNAGKANVGKHLIIPLTAPVEFTIGNHPRPIDPYILGALIGDGCISNSALEHGYVQMTTMDVEIRNRFTAAGYDMSHCYQKANNRSICYYIRDAKLIQQLRELGIAGNKSKDHVIPRNYMYAPIKERLALMQGLMDTDGYVDNRGHMSYTSISKQLAEDVAWIVRSLGGVATITTNSAGYRRSDSSFQQCNDAWDVQIRSKWGAELCGLTRKKERAKSDFNGGVSELGKRITDIEYIGEQESFCITVSDPMGLYITDNFTVTHNSYLGSCWLISSCLRWPDMRMVVARKTLKSLRESTWNTIQSVAKSWGLEEQVHFKINNLSGEMIFWNGSKIIMKEMAYSPSDPDYLRFGSSEFSGGFIDEVGEVDQRGVDVLFSRLRWKVAETTRVPKLFMSTNPCLGWVRDRFVLDENLEPVVCRPNEMYIPFSVYDNPDKNFVNAYVSALYKISDPSVRERLLFGNWLYVDINDAACYWKFDGAKHLVDGLKDSKYDPLKPLILSFDFNVAPYMSCLMAQIDYENKIVYILEEVLGKPENKENNTPKFAEKIKRLLLGMGHTGGVVVTGDPAGLSRTTTTEDGVNNYTILLSVLKNPQLRPRKKLLSKQPSQITRLEFVNNIFEGYDGWTIQIDLKCRKLIEDLINQRKEMDGSKSKAKVMDAKLGIKVEKYGHFSDTFDYFLVLFLNEPWKKFNATGSSGIVTFTGTPIYGSFEY